MDSIFRLRIERLKAREEVSKISPTSIWLAESTSFPYVERRRLKNELVNTDSMLYKAFDICYDYDLYGIWRGIVHEKLPLKSYLEMLRLQLMIYPKDLIKLRFVENHDQQRISYLFRDNRLKSLAWTGSIHFSSSLDLF